MLVANWSSESDRTSLRYCATVRHEVGLDKVSLDEVSLGFSCNSRSTVSEGCSCSNRSAVGEGCSSSKRAVVGKGCSIKRAAVGKGCNSSKRPWSAGAAAISEQITKLSIFFTLSASG